MNEGAAETTGTGRHTGVWSANRYRLSVTDAGALTVNENYVRCDGLQVTVVSPTASTRQVISLTSGTIDAGNAFYLSNSLILGHGHGTHSQSGVSIGDADANVTMWNCIVYGIGTPSGSRAVACAGTSANLYGCTLIGGGNALRCTAGTTAAKNVYAGGSSSEDFYTSATLAKTNCASEDQSADDTGTGETATNCVAAAVDCTTAGVTFTDPANGDFRVADTDSALYGVGATLTDDPPGSTALGVDIAGNARS